MPKVITSSEFDQDVLDNSKPVLVDFFATWCGPCKLLSPVLDKLDDEFKDTIEMYKVDIDENQGLARKYRVMSVPTMKIFKGGEVIETIVGAQPEDVLKNKLEYYAKGGS